MKFNIKNVFGIVMCICCIFTLVACNLGNGSNGPINKPKETATPDGTPASTPYPEITLPEDEFLPDETPTTPTTMPTSSSTSAPAVTQTPVSTQTPTVTTPAQTSTPNKTATPTVKPTVKPTATPKPSGGVWLPPDYL